MSGVSFSEGLDDVIDDSLEGFLLADKSHDHIGDDRDGHDSSSGEGGGQPVEFRLDSLDDSDEFSSSVSEGLGAGDHFKDSSDGVGSEDGDEGSLDGDDDVLDAVKSILSSGREGAPDFVEGFPGPGEGFSGSGSCPVDSSGNSTSDGVGS